MRRNAIRASCNQNEKETCRDPNPGGFGSLKNKSGRSGAWRDWVTVAAGVILRCLGAETGRNVVLVSMHACFSRNRMNPARRTNKQTEQKQKNQKIRKLSYRQLL